MRTALRDHVRKYNPAGLLALASILCLASCHSAGRGDGPVIAFLDAGGVIHLLLCPSDIDHPAPARFAGGPAIARTSDGSVLVAARDTSASVWMNLYVPSLQQWQAWRPGQGVFVGEPALVLDRRGTGWVALRDRFNTYWISRTDTSRGFGEWKNLGGVFSTDPVMITCPDGSDYVVGLDAGHALWSAHLVNGILQGTWADRAGVFRGIPAAACGDDSAAYLAARDQWNGTWIGRLAGNSWTGWINGGSRSATDPRLAALGGSIALVTLDEDRASWVCTIAEGTRIALTACSQGGHAFDAIAAAGWKGELFMAGHSSDDGVWWWTQSTGEWIAASAQEPPAKVVALAID